MKFIVTILCLLAFSSSAFAQSGWVKLWDDTGYKDRLLTVRFKQDIPDFHKVFSDDGKSGFNDKASSVKFSIPYGWQVVLYENKYYANKPYVLEGSGEVQDLGYFSDKASSIKWERK